MTNRENMTKLEWVFAVSVIVGGVVVGVVFSRCNDDKPRVSAPMASPQPLQTTVDSTSAARAVWAKFDALPAQQQTKEALGAHLKLANGADPSIPLRNFNSGQFRKRVAPKLGIGAFVEGEDLDYLVPRQTLNECVAWVVGTLDQETKDAMLSMNFSGVRCYGPGADGGRSLVREWQIP